MTQNPDWLRPLIAHRGLHGPGVPENSLAACLAAAEAGHAIEIDVQLSADGEAMVFHDETLDRLTAETGPVGARPAEALSRIGLLGTGETIPTLAALLDAVGDSAPIIVEIKDHTQRYEATDGRLEARVATLLQGHRGPAAAMSFNPASVAWLKANAPQIPRGLVACDFSEDAQLSPERRAHLGEMRDLGRIAAEFVSYDWRRLAAPHVQALRARMPLVCWTIKSPEAAAEAAPLCDALTFEGFSPAGSLAA